VKRTFCPGRILRLLFWETTIKCNLSCAHCRRLESDESVYKDLSTEQGKYLIKQLGAPGEKQSCTPVLVFSFARSLEIIPALATNATFIKDLAKMRDSESLEGKCGVCSYRQVCGGCRGRAYAATGNYMAQEPFCAYVPPVAVS